MKIMRASEKQLGELAELERMYMQCHANFDSYFAFDENLTTRWISYMKEFLSREDAVVLTAVENGRIIGYSTASIISRAPIYKMKRVGLVGDNFVLPEYRRKGVFSKLLEEVLSWMKGKGVEYVEHPVAAKNKVGRTVWRRRGFEDTTVFTKRKIV